MMVMSRLVERAPEVAEKALMNFHREELLLIQDLVVLVKKKMVAELEAERKEPRPVPLLIKLHRRQVHELNFKTMQEKTALLIWGIHLL